MYDTSYENMMPDFYSYPETECDVKVKSVNEFYPAKDAKKYVLFSKAVVYLSTTWPREQTPQHRNNGLTFLKIPLLYIYRV